MARSVARQAAMQLLYERMSGGEADDESLDLVYEQLTIGDEPASRKPTAAGAATGVARAARTDIGDNGGLQPRIPP